MTTAEARVQTERASRYLAQLCQHVTSISARGPAILRHRKRHGPGHLAQPAGAPPRAEWTETHGTLTFPGGTITLQVTLDALIVRADAATAPDLQRAQEMVGRHLAKYGRRDQLTVAWRPLEPPACPRAPSPHCPGRCGASQMPYVAAPGAAGRAVPWSVRIHRAVPATATARNWLARSSQPLHQ